MVAAQKVPKRSNQKRNVSSYRNSNNSHYRSKPAFNTSYQPPRYQQQQPPPRRTYYQPPPVHNNYRWQASSQPPIHLVQHPPIYIPHHSNQFQMQRQQQQPQPPPPNFFNALPTIPRMQNWLPQPPQPLMSISFLENYYESRPKVSIRPITPEIVPQIEEIISEDDEKSLEKEIDAMENISMEAVRSSSSDSNENLVVSEASLDDINLFETTVRPGPKENALPIFDRNDPVLQLKSQELQSLLTAGDKIERSLIPKELTDGTPFGLFISEVNSPAKFWFHLEAESPVLNSLMLDLE